MTEKAQNDKKAQNDSDDKMVPNLIFYQQF